MNDRASAHPPPASRHAPALGVLVAGLAVAVISWRAVDLGTHEAQRERFEASTDELAERLRARMGIYATVLRSARALFRTESDVSRDHFKTFVDGLELQRNYPGIQGIGYAARIEPGDRATLEHDVRAQGFPDFRVWPVVPEDQYPIVMLEPFDWRNQRAFGYDMHTEPVRRAAMDLAIESGQPTLSAPVELVQETSRDRQRGALLYVPIFDRDEAPTDPASRREALRGFVYAPFRLGDLLGQVVAEQSRNHAIARITDGGPTAAGDVLFTSEPVPERATRVGLRRVELFGRTWRVELLVLDRGGRFGERALPWLTLLASISIAVLTASIVYFQARARDTAESLSRRRDLLARSAAALGTSLDEEERAQTAVRGALELGEWSMLEVLDDERASVWLAGPGLPRSPWRGEPSTALTTPAVATCRFSELPVAWAAQLPEGWPGRDRTCTALPLRAQAQRIGLLVIVHGPDRSRPSLADRSLFVEYARLVSVAIENARLYRQAREAVAVRDEFLGVASHELRTPLTSLRLQLQRALRLIARHDDAERLEGVVEGAERQVRRLSALVDGLLDIARIAHGQLALELEEVDLLEVAREVVDRLSEEISTSGCRVDLQAPDGVRGRWDRLRVDQVLTNLLTNALKYGRGRPITIRLRATGAQAFLEVEDEGIGMTPEAAARVFDRFERAVSARRYAGLGLGLYIVRQVVEALGGHVGVTTAEGVGSTFTVELPLAGPEAKRPAGAGAADGAGAITDEPRAT